MLSDNTHYHVVKPSIGIPTIRIGVRLRTSGFDGVLRESLYRFGAQIRCHHQNTVTEINCAPVAIGQPPVV